ncbi:DUF6514 family protein [Caloramator proteoclasticus]|uniref:Uncharacterized protein n=1 Tax=Caloramator proteoclasticus DSM 10124 TaxID=1121262 RepID=A0A1M4YUV2_9CLOT|nr:DUF6514 family protein [Caloramator proteoclasticus]SHF09540.1 hypothetical protein SAMN02746091_01756 [Caloramator proteoclasticus DSM 10124]
MKDVVEIASCRTILDDNRSYIYRYYMVKNCKKFYVKENELEIKCYGIEVVREDYDKNKIVATERERIDFVSTDRTKVIKLLIELQRNEVSPVHLLEVVGEYVDEWTSDFDNEISKLEAKLVFA